MNTRDWQPALSRERQREASESRVARLRALAGPFAAHVPDDALIAAANGIGADESTAYFRLEFASAVSRMASTWGRPVTYTVARGGR